MKTIKNYFNAIFLFATFLILLPSCGNDVCMDPDSLNFEDEGSCVLFEDIFEGKFRVTEWLFDFHLGDGFSADLTSVDLEYEFSNGNFNYQYKEPDDIIRGGGTYTISKIRDIDVMTLTYDDESVHGGFVRGVLEPIFETQLTPVKWDEMRISRVSYDISSGIVSDQRFILSVSYSDFADVFVTMERID